MKASTVLAVGAAGVALMAAPAANAAILTFDLDVEFSGGTQPAGPTPWISATFDDSFGGPNTVRLTMSTANLVGSEFVGEWSFNFDPALDPTALTFAAVDVSDIGAHTISTGVNAFQADGDGKFDILFDFPPPPGAFADKFTSGETVVYDITYTGPIDVSSFNFLSAPGGGSGSFLSAAHVQAIGTSDGSGWIGPGDGDGIPVPEPATLTLFGVGLLATGWVMRRRG